MKTKLKNKGLKFLLGVLILFLFSFLYFSVSSVLNKNEYKYSSFVNSLYVNNETNNKLYFLSEEYIFFTESDRIRGDVLFEDNIFFLSLSNDENLTLVVINKDLLFDVGDKIYYEKN